MFLLLDKPSGRTSFDCIRKLQKLCGKKIYDRKVKIGHAGTLDPMATGLMIIAIGPSTKKLGSLTGLDKVYTTTIDLSQMSDTWDDDAWGWRAKWSQESGKWSQEIRARESRISKKEGIKNGKKIKSRHPEGNEGSNTSRSNKAKLLTENAKKRGYMTTDTPSIPSKDQMHTVLNGFVDRKEFLLTPFSAKKIDGKKLYEYARDGNPILKQSPMNMIGYKLIDYQFPYVTVQFHVGSGTYIRSLAYELGNALGRGGILISLRRERIGDYSL